ncbi:hypothetical protein C7U57_23485 [Pseudomonas sp. R9.37]|nr:hypothetical protein C7U57_23485 [Pseudomonas sp. R9.37]
MECGSLWELACLRWRPKAQKHLCTEHPSYLNGTILQLAETGLTLVQACTEGLQADSSAQSVIGGKPPPTFLICECSLRWALACLRWRPPSQHTAQARQSHLRLS